MRMNTKQHISVKVLFIAAMVMALLAGCASQQSGSSPAPSQAASSSPAPAASQAPKDTTQ